MFAFMHLTWIHIVGGLIALSILSRAAGRRPDGSCKRRGWFPWKIAILVVLAVVAIKHFDGPHRENTPAERVSTTAMVEAARSAKSHFQGGSFPPVKKDDLRALRKAQQKSARSQSDEAGEPEVAEAVEDADTVAVAERQNDKTTQPADPSAAAAEVRADVARTVAEAKAVAHRAVAEAREIYTATARDVARTVFGARNATANKTQQADTAVSEQQKLVTTADTASQPQHVEAALVQKAAIVAESVPLTVPAAPESPAAPSAPLVPAVPAAAPAAAIARAPAAQATAEVKNDRPVMVAPPDWLNAPTGLKGDVYYTTVTVGPWKSVQECDDELIPKVKQAVSKYVDSYLGDGASKTIILSLPYIHDHIIRDRYVQEFESETPSVNTMVNLHVRLGFDGRTRAQLKRTYREAQVESRLLEVGAGAGAALLVLGAVFGYLKLDTMTRGFYTRRLQLAAGAVILATLAAAGAMYGDAARNLRHSPAWLPGRGGIELRSKRVPTGPNHPNSAPAAVDDRI